MFIDPDDLNFAMETDLQFAQQELQNMYHVIELMFACCNLWFRRKSIKIEIDFEKKLVIYKYSIYITNEKQVFKHRIAKNVI